MVQQDRGKAGTDELAAACTEGKGAGFAEVLGNTNSEGLALKGAVHGKEECDCFRR